MPVPCKVAIDAGSTGLVSVPTSAFLIIQGTNGASKPVRLKRIQLESNQTGSNQQTIAVALVTYATGTSTGGAARTAIPIDDALVGVYSPATAFYAATATLGTTPTYKSQWVWNTANPFDLTQGMIEIQDEFASGKVWALIIPTGPGTGFSIAGTINFEEFG